MPYITIILTGLSYNPALHSSCLNVTTALTGPLLYSIWPQFPYIVAGTLTMLWAFVLIYVLSKRMRMNKTAIIQRTHGTFVKVKKKVQLMSFIHLEVLSRSIDEDATLVLKREMTERQVRFQSK